MDAGTGMDAVSTALMGQFTAVGTAIQAMIVDILPVVLPLIGAVFVIKKGIALFKGIAAKAS